MKFTDFKTYEFLDVKEILRANQVSGFKYEHMRRNPPTAVFILTPEISKSITNNYDNESQGSRGQDTQLRQGRADKYAILYADQPTMNAVMNQFAHQILSMNLDM